MEILGLIALSSGCVATIVGGYFLGEAIDRRLENKRRGRLRMDGGK